MKKIISSVCLVALLAGCAEEENVATVPRRPGFCDHPAYAYSRPVRGFPRIVAEQPEQVEITKTQQFLAHRLSAARRRKQLDAMETQAYATGPARPSGQVSASTPPPPPVRLPPPGPGPGGPPPGGPAPGAATPDVLTSPEPISPPAPPSVPAPVAEPPNSSSNSMPMGNPVSGKPGYVTSPFAPSAGYVDVNGLPSGSEARDPYTGKIFRVP